MSYSDDQTQAFMGQTVRSTRTCAGGPQNYCKQQQGQQKQKSRSTIKDFQLDACFTWTIGCLQGQFFNVLTFLVLPRLVVKSDGKWDTQREQKHSENEIILPFRRARVPGEQDHCSQPG